MNGHKTWTRGAAAFTGLALILTFGVCDDSESPTEPETLELAIVFSAAELTLDVGESATVEATVIDPENVIYDVPLAWTSTDDAVVRVTQDGAITGMSPGVAFVHVGAREQARNQNCHENRFVVRVRDNAAVIEVTPAGPVELRPEETITLVGVVKDADGDVLNRPITWTVDEPEIASVSGEGVVTALTAGVAIVRAQAGPARVWVNIVVLPPAAD